MEVPRVLNFTTDSVIVFIDWIQTQHHDQIAYTVDAIPQMTVTSTNSTGTTLQVSYNTRYNVSITATLCEYRNATTIVALNESSLYSTIIHVVRITSCPVKCVHPLNLSMIDDSVRALLDSDSTLVETNTTFSCLPGLEFRGPYKSICMVNGEWEPDPSEVDCLGKVYNIY